MVFQNPDKVLARQRRRHPKYFAMVDQLLEYRRLLREITPPEQSATGEIVYTPTEAAARDTLYPRPPPAEPRKPSKK
jgi:hypothetical protein